VARTEKDTKELHPVLDGVERQRLARRGVELFEQGRYFDAHEPWETIWRSRDPEPRELYQGLVQVAAGFHHWFTRGRAGAAARLLERGARRLEAYAGARAGDVPAGLEAVDLVAFGTQLRVWIAWLATPSGAAPPAPRLQTVATGRTAEEE
jgi:hypothetical protein